MSYRSRQKKRQKKLAYQRSVARSRRTGETAQRWFLTLAKKPGKYTCCADSFERGAEIVYRHEPREVRCVRCADRDPESSGYRPSLRWERARRVPKATGR